MATNNYHAPLNSSGEIQLSTEIEVAANPTNTNSGEIQLSMEIEVAANPTNTNSYSTAKIIYSAFTAIYCIALSLVVAFYCGRAYFTFPASVMAVYLKIHLDNFKAAEDDQHTREGVYSKIHISKYKNTLNYHQMSEKSFFLGFILLLWSGLNYHLPIFQRAPMLFQQPLWKWSFLAASLTFIYSWTIFHSKPRLYVTFERQIQERVHLNRFPIDRAWFYGTLLSLICFKDFDKAYFWSVLPIWVGVAVLVQMCVELFIIEQRVIHKRFRKRIQIAGFQYFFLSLFIERIEIPSVLPCWCEYRGGGLGCPSFACYKRSPPRMFRSLYNILMHLEQMPRYDIEYSIRHLTRMPLARCIAKIDQICQERFREDSESAQVYVTKELLLKSMDEECADILIELLQEELLCDNITCEALKQWMMDAHKNCWYLGSTLNGAHEFMRMCVILSCATSLVVVAALIWLHPADITPYLWNNATKQQPAKVVPIVGVALLCSVVVWFFQDIIKTSLQVLLFLFVNRNYGIGDICIIEDKEVEITRIRLQTTTYLILGEREVEISRRNSYLMNIDILRCAEKPNTKDSIELELIPSTSSSVISDLQTRIKNFLDNDRRVIEYSTEVNLVTIGSDSMKLTIEFTHRMNVHVSHSLFHRMKKKRQTAFRNEFVRFVEELRTEADREATPPPPPPPPPPQQEEQVSTPPSSDL